MSGKTHGQVSYAVIIRSVFSAALFCTACSAGPSNAVIVRADSTVGTINPNIYGHFAEHLGNCIYEGIWVGPNSPIENVRGIRTDVVNALKKLKPPVVRWPGGCFADSYHWRDGIGPRHKRPKRVNVHWGRVVELNQFGTDEFIDFCRQIGAEPLVAANVGSGTAAEMRDWLEYMNRKDGSTLAQMRAANGHPEPFNVRYICIGNENWGCGGSMSPGQYARLYRRFATFCHFAPAEAGLYKIACGPSGTNYDWTRGFFEEITGRVGYGRNRLGAVQAFDLHYYTRSRGYGTATDYTTEQFYGFLAKCLRIEKIIQKHWDIMGQYDPEHRVKLAVCEWGAWHKVIEGTNPRFLRQQNSIRDALLAGLTLNIFNRHCDKIDMANIAQMINVLQCMILTRGPRMVLTPTYHVFEMYVPHQHGEALGCEVLSEKIEFTLNGSTETIDRIAASCSRKADTITLSLVNTCADRPTDVAIVFFGIDDVKLKSWRVLAGDDIHACNSFDQPNRVTPAPMAGPGDGTELTLLPASVNVLTYQVSKK